MTKKHFIAIARVLKANNASLVLCADMAHEFACINPAFDKARFLKACGHG